MTVSEKQEWAAALDAEQKTKLLNELIDFFQVVPLPEIAKGNQVFLLKIDSKESPFYISRIIFL